MSNRYYIRFRGRVLGPMTEEKVLNSIQRGQITRMHELSPDGLEWRRAETFNQFFEQKEIKSTSSATTTPNETDGSEEPQVQLDMAAHAQPSIRADKWHVNINGAALGPVDDSTVKQWIGLDKVTQDTLVWKEGMTDWLPASLSRPQWFSGGASANRINEAVDTSASSNFLGSIINEQRIRNGWVHIIAVIGLIALAFEVIGSIFLLVTNILAPADSSGEAIVNVFISILFLGISVAGFIACVRLFQYGSAVNVMKYAPNEACVLRSLRLLSRFWFFSGVYVFALVMSIAAIFLIAYAFGVHSIYMFNR